MKANKLLLLGASLAVLTGCNQESSSEKKNPADEPLISFVDTANGKKLVVKGYYESSVGAFGVLISYDDIDSLSPLYSQNYDSVREENGKYICTSSIESEHGSKFTTTDVIYEKDGHIKIEREFEVKKAAALDLGFSVYFQMEDVEGKDPLDYKWFCPSNYYGNDEWTFTGVGVKTAYSTDNSVVMNDNSGTPVLMNYANNMSFALLDTSDGFRETIAADYGVHDCHIQVDSRFNVGGVGLKDLENGHTQVFQNYPTYSYNMMGIFNFMTQYRMLPVEEGLTRKLSFDINCKQFDDFYQACKENYRYSYDHYVVTDKRYSAEEVYQESLAWLDRSYGVKSNIPQYMLNSDHPWPDSGFLYRNSDIAYLMLAAGRRMSNQKYIDNALAVLENQISNDRLDKGLIAGGSDKTYRQRSSTDALYNLCLNYETEAAAGFKHNDWLNYLRNKANERLTDPLFWGDAMFLSEFGKLTKTKSYITKARELMDGVKEKHLEYHYTGTISNPNAEKIIEKEGAIIAMISNINIYEALKDSDPVAAAEYLDMAEHNALAVETFQIIQPVCLDSYDNPGYGKDPITEQEFNQGSMGNGRFLAYGINYVCSQTASGDNASVLVAPDFYKLAQYTGDQHYYSFYEFLTYNSTLYVNMGDKCGHMDDILYSSGKGFQNEYFGVSTSEDPASYKRGSIHDSNLAWNMYAVVANYERMHQILGNGKYVACDDLNRDFDIKKNKYCTKTNDGYVVDLNEFCKVSSITGYTENVEFSVDGIEYTAGKISSVARYVRFPLSVDMTSVKIMGLPLTYSALNYATEASVNLSTFKTAQDWNYNTVASMDKNVEIIIDLGGKHAIAEVALKAEQIIKASFDVYVSKDGTNFEEYGSFVNAAYFLHVIEKPVDGVQYVKLVNRGTTGPISVKEVKVLGY